MPDTAEMKQVLKGIQYMCVWLVAWKRMQKANESSVNPLQMSSHMLMFWSGWLLRHSFVTMLGGLVCIGSENNKIIVEVRQGINGLFWFKAQEGGNIFLPVMHFSSKEWCCLWKDGSLSQTLKCKKGTVHLMKRSPLPSNIFLAACFLFIKCVFPTRASIAARGQHCLLHCRKRNWCIHIV